MSESIFTEADRLIHGPRRDAYGGVVESFQAVAEGWARIFKAPVTAEQVALAMVWLKVLRENNSHQRDNLVDVCGYAGLAFEIAEAGHEA